MSQKMAEAGSQRAEVATSRIAFGREVEVQTRRVADQLTEEFEANFRVFEQTQQARFENTEEEMSSQNYELQDEMTAAEQALEMERRNKGPTWTSPLTSVAEPRNEPAFSEIPISPSARFEPPRAAWSLFEKMNPTGALAKPIPTAALVASPYGHGGLGAYAPPGPPLAPSPAALRESRARLM